MKTQPKISTSYDSLFQLHKCNVGLEINKKIKEIVKSRYKKKLCFIRQILAPIIKGIDVILKGYMNQKIE